MSVPATEAKRLVNAVIKGEAMSRHDKLVMGVGFRRERLRRIEPGGMYNPDGTRIPPERIAWSRRRLARTMELERRLWAEIVASGGQ